MISKIIADLFQQALHFAPDDEKLQECIQTTTKKLSEQRKGNLLTCTFNIVFVLHSIFMYTMI